MDDKELKIVFDAQKERMRSAIQELSELRELLQGEERMRVDSTLRLLRESLENDERTSTRLQSELRRHPH